MTLQPFLNYNLDKGWYLLSAPLITANWEADGDNRWTVPIGGGFGRIFKIGHQPINAQLTAYYNAVKPDDTGADWQLRASGRSFFQNIERLERFRFAPIGLGHRHNVPNNVEIRGAPGRGRPALWSQKAGPRPGTCWKRSSSGTASAHSL